jgi:hypothetical protein
VRARVTLLDAELEQLSDARRTDATSEAAEKRRKRIKELLERAADATETRGPTRWGRDFIAWWRGSAIERAWLSIHDAELLLVEWRSLPQLKAGRAALLSLVTQAIPAKDHRRKEIEEQLTDRHWRTPMAANRIEYEVALREAYQASDAQYARVRSFRNCVMTASVIMLLLVGALAGLGFADPEAVPLCFAPDTPAGQQPSGDRAAGATTQATICPTSEHGGPSGGDIAIVELLGVLGAAAAAGIAIRRIRGTSTPYSVPIVLAVFKLPAGAFAAFMGLLLLHAGFVPGFSALDSQGEILGYALVFGFSQELATRLVDQRAQAVLDQTPETEPSDPTKTATNG